MNWKIIAIIFVIIFLIENVFLFWSYMFYVKEEQNTKECFYDICEEYPDAWYEEGVCYCYDYDMMGEPVLSKTKVIN